MFYVSALPESINVCAPQVCGTHGGWKRVMDHLELDLQSIMTSKLGSLGENPLLLTAELPLQHLQEVFYGAKD